MSEIKLLIHDPRVDVSIDDGNVVVITGDGGPQGPTGNTGPAGPASTVPGPQGEQGPQGLKGDKGDKGDPGEGLAYFEEPLTYDDLTSTIGLAFDPTTLEVGLSGLTVVGGPSTGGNADTLDTFDSTYFLNTSADSQSKGGNLALTGTGTMEILDLNEASMTAKVSTINVTTPLLIDAFVANNYRSAEYILQFSQGSLNFSMTKLMLIHDGTDVAISEYGHVEVGTPIPYTFNAAFSLGSLEITIQCSNSNITPVNLKFSRVLFDV